MDNRKYTKFSRKIDNAGTTVSGNDINETQKSINILETNNFKGFDNDFVLFVLRQFEEIPIVNSMFMNETGNSDYSDFSKGRNTYFDTNDLGIKVSKGVSSGVYYSSQISSYAKEGVFINSFIFYCDYSCPVGTDIKFFLTDILGKDFPITPNNHKPLILSDETVKVTFKAELTCNSFGESPIINSYAVLYFDEFVESQMGLIDKDLTNDVKVSPQIITLVRDNTDRLCRVEGSMTDVDLLYNEDGELITVEEKYKDGRKKEVNDLFYGDYLNSQNEHERVLYTVKTTTKF